MGAWPRHRRAEHERHAGVDRGELLEDDGDAELPVSQPAELLGDDEPSQPEVVALLDEIPVELLGRRLVEAPNGGRDALAYPLAHAVAQRLDVGRQGGEGGDVERALDGGDGHGVLLGGCGGVGLGTVRRSAGGDVVSGRREWGCRAGSCSGGGVGDRGDAWPGTGRTRAATAARIR